MANEKDIVGNMWHSVAGDVASALAVVGGLAGYLPPIATICAIIWYALNIYDWVQNHRAPAPPGKEDT